MRLKVNDVKVRAGGYRSANCKLAGDKAGAHESVNRVEIEFIPNSESTEFFRPGNEFEMTLTPQEISDEEKLKRRKLTDRKGFKGQRGPLKTVPDPVTAIREREVQPEREADVQG